DEAVLVTVADGGGNLVLADAAEEAVGVGHGAHPATPRAAHQVPTRAFGQAPPPTSDVRVGRGVGNCRAQCRISALTLCVGRMWPPKGERPCKRPAVFPSTRSDGAEAGGGGKHPPSGDRKSTSELQSRENLVCR